MHLRNKKRLVDEVSETDIEIFFNNPLHIKIVDYKQGVELFEKFFTKSRIELTFYDKLESNSFFLEEIINFTVN
jgi:hypothetical protein